MKILLFDNGTKYLTELHELLNKFGEVSVTNKVTDLTPNSADLIVLSGGHSLYVNERPDAYKVEMEFIKNSQKPILGLCLGAELIAYTFGAKLEFLNNNEQGLMNIEVLQKDDIFKNIVDFKVYENHKLSITSLSPNLVGLAKSKDGFEVVKHISKPIYGLQFHPEMFEDKASGDEIFANLLKSFSK